MSNTFVGPTAAKAGYDAYYAADAGGHFGANLKPRPQTPAYSKNPQRAQWIKGWQFAHRNHSSGGQFSFNPFVGVDLSQFGRDPIEKQAKQKEFQRKQAEFKAKQKQKEPVKAKVNHTPWREIKHKFVADAQNQATPTVNLKRLDKFNKKHRTKV